MSAAQAVLVQTASYSEPLAPKPRSEELVRELIHDLRQPLSSIEAIAYYLEMTLPADQIQARLYMRRLQQLVDQTSCVLEDAAAGVRNHAVGAA